MIRRFKELEKISYGQSKERSSLGMGNIIKIIINCNETDFFKLILKKLMEIFFFKLKLYSRMTLDDLPCNCPVHIRLQNVHQCQVYHAQGECSIYHF